MTAVEASVPSDLPDAGAAPSAPEGLYVHVPFCVSVCPYCDFVVYAGAAARGPRNRVAELVTALHAELDLRTDDLPATPLTSVYLGGGTPSLLAAADIADLLAHVDRRLGLASTTEVTLEVNPGTDDGTPSGCTSSRRTGASCGGSAATAQTQVTSAPRRRARARPPA